MASVPRLAVSLLCILAVVCHRVVCANTAPFVDPLLPPITDTFYDCFFRELAYNYSRDVVVSSWPSISQANEALSNVAEGLALSQCTTTGSSSLQASPPISLDYSKPRRHRHQPSATAKNVLQGAVHLFVETNGDDSALGTDPLNAFATIDGARQAIRKRFPAVDRRPKIVVHVGAGDFFLPQRSPAGTRRTHAVFDENDSGSSKSNTISYSGDSAEGTVLHGGVVLQDLVWQQVPNRTYHTVQTTLPQGTSISAMDQLYVLEGNIPLIRGRFPNGKPWLPLDGFNMTTVPLHGTPTIPNVPTVATKCAVNHVPQAPPKPSPMPRPAAPTDYPPPLGKCTNLAGGQNVSLLYGFPLVDTVLVDDHCPSAAQCASECSNTSCCAGFTWHDATCGPYSFHCYFVTNPLQIWTRALHEIGHVSGACNHVNNHSDTCPWDVPITPCQANVQVACDPNKPTPRRQTIVAGPLGINTGSASIALHNATAGVANGTVGVQECYAHLPDSGNSWPEWKASAYGIRPGQGNLTNILDMSQNFPLWYGPWAGGVLLNVSQDRTGLLSRIPWTDAIASQIVVHAMADGEWGGVQFQASSLSNSSVSDPLGVVENVGLLFSIGGFQQARGATLSTNNRFYMEGPLEFTDSPGEWHYDEGTRVLTLVLPEPLREHSRSFTGGDENLDLVLTQTNSIFRLEGSSSTEGRLKNLEFSNMTLEHTSAEFFLPHEESSGGDYAIHRGGVIFMENVSQVSVTSNVIQNAGGNGVFLSNAVSDIVVSSNHMQFIGSSAVSVVGKTGAAMMDARDGECLAAAGFRDNGVRLPKNVMVSNNGACFKLHAARPSIQLMLKYHHHPPNHAH